MLTSEPDLLAYLDRHAIRYLRAEHPPVYTCAEAARLRSPMPGLETKNLFLRDEAPHGAADKPGNFYLVVTDCAKRLDLKGLGRALGASKLHFASPGQLLDVLGLTPGAVTMLALANDSLQRVTLLVDADFWPAAAYLCHPLVNTATLVLEHAELMRFLGLTGHAPRVVAMPGLEPPAEKQP